MNIHAEIADILTWINEDSCAAKEALERLAEPPKVVPGISEELLAELDAIAAKTPSAPLSKLDKPAPEPLTTDHLPLIEQCLRKVVADVASEAGHPGGGDATQQEDEPEYMFVREGDVWRTRYGIDCSFLRRAGMPVIAELLARPYHPRTFSSFIPKSADPAPALFAKRDDIQEGDRWRGACCSAGNVDDKLDPKALEAFHKALQAIDHRLTKPDLGPSERRELEEQREGILREMRESLTQNGKIRKFRRSELWSDANSVREAVRRSIVIIGKDNPDLARHLDASIDRSAGHLMYQPSPVLKWVVRL